MLRIGLIGESEFDRESLRLLLLKVSNRRFAFVELLSALDGDKLESRKALRILEMELTTKQLDLIIVQRDLDKPYKREIRDSFFRNVTIRFRGETISLLHIYAFEALLIADLNSFNSQFGLELNYRGNPETINDPKTWLRSRCRNKTYRPSDSPRLLSVANIDVIRRRVPYFNNFVNNFLNYLSNNP